MYLLLLVLLPDAGVLDGEDDEAIGILLVLQKTKIIEHDFQFNLKIMLN